MIFRPKGPSVRPARPLRAGNAAPVEKLLRPKGSVVRSFEINSMNGRPVGPQKWAVVVTIPGPQGPGWTNGWTFGPENSRSFFEITLPSEPNEAVNLPRSHVWPN